MTQVATPVDGIFIDDDTAVSPNPGLANGIKFKVLSQTAACVATTNAAIANQEMGWVASPATTGAGVTATVVVNNTLVTANSVIEYSFAQRGATVLPTTWYTAATSALVAGTSFTVAFTAGAALAANALWIVFRIIN